MENDDHYPSAESLKDNQSGKYFFKEIVWNI